MSIPVLYLISFLSCSPLISINSSATLRQMPFPDITAVHQTIRILLLTPSLRNMIYAQKAAPPLRIRKEIYVSSSYATPMYGQFLYNSLQMSTLHPASPR